MRNVDDLLGQLDPVRDDEVARLEERIRAQATEQRGLKVLLNQLEAPSEVALSRLEARVASTIASRRRQAGLVRRWAPAGMALAAMALVVGLTWTPTPTPVSAGTLPLDGISQLQPLEDVVLDYGGLGEATWDGKVVRIDWDEGTLTSSVTPKQGIDLSVHTREAVVSVVGTAFTVTRDADGSHVSVEHGVVAVDCEASGSVTLRAGEAHTCGPVSAGQWLVQIDRLFASGSDSERIRTSIRRGIRYSAVGDPLRGELLARDVQVLLRDGNRSEAAAVAQQYLDEGYTVRAQQLLPVTEVTP